MKYVLRLLKYLPAGVAVASKLARGDTDGALRTLRRHELDMRDRQEQRLQRLKSGERRKP